MSLVEQSTPLESIGSKVDLGRPIASGSPPTTVESPKMADGTSNPPDAKTKEDENTTPLRRPTTKSQHRVFEPHRRISQLTEQDWIDMIKRSGVLSGIRMDADMDDSIGPSITGLPLVGWRESLVHIRPDSRTYTGSEQTTSQRQMSYLKAGWVKQALNVKPPYVSVDVNAELQHTTSTKRDETRKFYKAVQTYERVRLTIDPGQAHEVLNKNFMDELAAALKDEDKRERLRKLFEKWGHVFSTEVILGAERQLHTEATNTSEQTEHHIKHQLEAAVQSNAPVVPVELRTSANWSKDQTEAYNQAINRIGSYFVGGQSELHSDNSLEDWRESIESPEYWTVVRRTKIIPIVELLPRDIQQQIHLASRKPLQGRWMYSQIERVKCKHFQVYQPKLSKEDIAKGWYYLGQSYDGSRALIIRDAPGEKGAIIPVKDSLESTVWHTHHITHTDNFCTLEAQSIRHCSVGSFFYSSLHRPGHSSHSVIEGHGQTSGICAVRTDLLALAKYEEAPVWNSNALKSMKNPGSLWRIVSDTAGGHAPTLDLQLFRASNALGKPTEMVMGLREECVDFDFAER